MCYSSIALPHQERFLSERIKPKAAKRREFLVHEMNPREEEVLRDREDDWFVLLTVVPREIPYVPPGMSKLTFQAIPKHGAFDVAI